MSNEPVITAGVIQTALVAIVNVLVAFNVLSIDDSQMSAINASLAAVLPILFALVVRQKVTPV